jgi:hypothetical protein
VLNRTRRRGHPQVADRRGPNEKPSREFKSNNKINFKFNKSIVKWRRSSKWNKIKINPQRNKRSKDVSPFLFCVFRDALVRVVHHGAQ